MAISISNNTIIKLIARQGSDSERKNIILNSGELGYTVDTERLYVGNGTDEGGKLVGNLFKGSNPDITIFSPTEIGDLAFNNDSNVLYRLKENDGSQLSDWEEIASKGLKSDVSQAKGGIHIENIVRVTTSEWSSLSSNKDPNTFYVVSDQNFFINYENFILY